MPIRKALLVGLNAYQDAPLRGCINAVKQMKELLQRFYGSLNFSQFVEGRRWGPWAREGSEEAYVFAGEAPCHGGEICRATARFDALQSVRNCASFS